MTGPWPDVLTAQRHLDRLASGVPWRHDNPTINVDALARWLISQGLGPLAYRLNRHTFPALTERLKSDAFSALAENSMHFGRLEQIRGGFQHADLPIVVLKGAALAESVYGDTALRPMADVDIWVTETRMVDAVAIMQELGFRAWEKQRRPLSLQELSRGEIQFYGMHDGCVELHWSPFPGWWLNHVAAVDDEAIWSRIEPLSAQMMPDSSTDTRKVKPSSAPNNQSSHHLAAEDMVIQLAVHTAVTHQFGQRAVQGLMDIVLTTRARPVDWKVVARRARRWRLAVAVWLVIHFADRLIGLEEARPLLVELEPSQLRQRLLQALISPEKVLAGDSHLAGNSRYLLLLLLVDRPRDIFGLIYRTLWPEREWLEARYQGRKGRLGHLWSVVRHGQI